MKKILSAVMTVTLLTIALIVLKNIVLFGEISLNASLFSFFICTTHAFFFAIIILPIASVADITRNIIFTWAGVAALIASVIHEEIGYLRQAQWGVPVPYKMEIFFIVLTMLALGFGAKMHAMYKKLILKRQITDGMASPAA